MFRRILRYIIVFFIYLFLANGISISYGGDVLLFISGSIFRYAFFCDVLMFFLEDFSLWLYNKFCFIFKLTNNYEKN